MMTKAEHKIIAMAQKALTEASNKTEEIQHALNLLQLLTCPEDASEPRNAS